MVDEAVQLIDHEAESMKLLLRGVQMRADVLSEEDFSGLLVGVDVADAQQKAEVLANVLEELRLCVEAQRAASFDEDFEFVAAVGVVVVALHEASVDLAV